MKGWTPMAKVNQRTGEVVMNMNPAALTNVGVLNMLDMIESLDAESLVTLAGNLSNEFEMPVFDFSLIHPDGTFRKADISHLYDQKLLNSTSQALRARLANDDES